MCHDLYLIDENIAIIAAQTEVLKMLENVFGKDARLIKFLFRFDRAPTEDYSAGVTNEPPKDYNFESKRLDVSEISFEYQQKVVRKANHQFGLLYDFVNVFAQADGFKNIEATLNAILDSGSKSGYKMISGISSPFSNLRLILNEVFAKKFVNFIKEKILSKLQCLSDNELRDIQ